MKHNVQKGDPFLERLLLEACTEISNSNIFESNILEGMQDMGAGGLLCASLELIQRGREKTGKNYWYFAEQYFYSPNQPVLEYFQNENSFNYRWNNVNTNFKMPIDLLVNGKIKRIIPSNNFQSFKISKHSQIEVMDWKFYVKPLQINR